MSNALRTASWTFATTDGKRVYMVNGPQRSADALRKVKRENPNTQFSQFWRTGTRPGEQ